ncbi:MAG: hypothetical protein F6K23_34265 [Okeania sp. SIO2C9]|uniref:hypothetical protein n=1 Tax=Okeania sp. SIO2C9 TaxID=2607791 RepID=UPI0013C0FA2C|nr:hypothetical protein [Okeania sp. SIO2C9]NEQ77636.1 hypothetical protein [Okeania sp. SIO2C9]
MLPHWQTRAAQTKSAQKFGKTQKVGIIVQETFLFRNTFGTGCYPIGKPERLKQNLLKAIYRGRMPFAPTRYSGSGKPC